ncbi:MAG: hypothetical protein IKR29_04500 [Bacteroidales bacterium]|nr:hypothetical protein [Bacteroidales bacterium]
MKQLNEPQKHARQIHLDDYLSINESQAKDEYGLEDGMLNWFPGREQAAVVKFNGDVFVKKDAVQDFLNRGILFQIGDPCNMRLSYRRPKMLTDVPLFGYTVDFHHFNRLIDEGMTNPTAGGALSLCHYDKECEEVEHELEELESAKTPATMQRFIRELKLTAPQSIEKLEDLGILVPIEKSDNLGDYHEIHKSQQNNEK